MRTRSFGVALAILAAGWAATPAVAADRLEPLRQYTVTGATAADLAAAGFDMRETHRTRRGQLIVATAAQAAALETKGADVRRARPRQRRRPSPPPTPARIPRTATTSSGPGA